MAIVILVALLGVLGYILDQNGTLEEALSMVKGVLSAQQIAQYASDAGFSGEDLITAVAIAKAESSGNPSAYNPEIAAGNPQGKGSYGLWQINLNAHPEFSSVNLFDPQTNAAAAFEIYSRSGFSPWSTFKTGAYLTHVTDAQIGVTANG